MAIGIRRREFIAALGSAAAWPVVARAQTGDRVRRIGVLMGTGADDPEGQARVSALGQGLKALGWTDGSNFQIEYRWTAGDAARTQAYAAELVGLAPDVILVNSPQIVRAVQQRTRTIPIVFALVVDPVGEGFVESLAHPSGNITGFTSFEYAMGGKWLEVLREIAPRVGRVVVINEPENVTAVGYLRTLQSFAPAIGVQLIPAHVHDVAEIEQAIDALGRESNGGFIVLPSPIALVYREQIVALAARYRLPAVYPFRYFVTSGGLVSYGIDSVEIFRRSASYIDRILKGEKPADLPVQNPTKYELVINLKTAKSLGLTVPPALLATADEVVE